MEILHVIALNGAQMSIFTPRRTRYHEYSSRYSLVALRTSQRFKRLLITLSLIWILNSSPNIFNSYLMYPVFIGLIKAGVFT